VGSVATVRTKLSVALVAALAVTAAGCGGDDDVDLAAGEVELLEAGSGEMIQLPGPYRRGQSTNNVFTVDQAIEGAGINVEVNVELEADSRVANVEGGEATVEQRIGRFTVNAGDQPVSAPEIDELLDLRGKVLTTVYDERGRQVGGIERADGGQLPPGFEEFQTGGAELAFPDEPVGVGARWVAGVESQIETGPPIEAEVTYELAELTNDSYVIEMSGDTPIEEEVDDIEFSGDLTQAGELRGDPRNPLAIEMTYDVGFEATADGESFSTTVTAEATSTPG
jgi:Family of unknown function (DUF6263)